MQTAMVVGSIAQIATQERKSIAETFVSCDAIVIVDVSGSMTSPDSRGGRRRYDVALEELARLQRDLPGKIGVIAFSDYAQFVPGGVPPFLAGGTDLTGALKFAKVADVPAGIRFIVISDGEPDNARSALEVARTYRNRIDTIHVGPESDLHAREFLRELAAASGGIHVNSPRALELESNIKQLLLGSG
jgi:Mg-chelatase subunit ChlD